MVSFETFLDSCVWLKLSIAIKFYFLYLKAITKWPLVTLEGNMLFPYAMVTVLIPLSWKQRKTEVSVYHCKW